MKKSIMTMCISAMLGLCIPAIASEPENAPPVKQEIKVVSKTDLPKTEENVAPVELTPVTSENGNEMATSESAHGGYIVISSAGLLLLIILLILLL